MKRRTDDDNFPIMKREETLSSPLAFCEDCLHVLPSLPAHSIDMVLCDLPYHVTHNPWDQPLPMEDYLFIENERITFSEFQQILWNKRCHRKTRKSIQNFSDKSLSEIITFWKNNKQPGLWSHYGRILKPHGVIVLFGSGMFSAELMMTGKSLWRYNLIWEKKHPTGFLNVNRMPLRSHEDILIFYPKLPAYHPQKTSSHPPVHHFVKHTSDGTNYGKTKTEISGGGSTERFPTSIWCFGSDTQKEALHPTQKPVALCEELIKTYTDEGNWVLDHCAGSFTTAVACDNLKRNWIAMEKEKSYFDQGLHRVNENRKRQGLVPVQQSFFEK